MIKWKYFFKKIKLIVFYLQLFVNIDKILDVVIIICLIKFEYITLFPY